MGKTLTVLALLAGLLVLSAPVAARDFPHDARRGTITAHKYPHYKIGSTTYRLATGGRIYNEQNLIIVPVSLQRPRAEVMYRFDLNGDLAAIWLLTPAEAKQYPKPGSGNGVQ